jgi:hypothetical protein
LAPGGTGNKDGGETMTNNMKTPIEYIIVAVPFHADAATHDELARKVNEKLNVVMSFWGRPSSARK